MYQLLKAVYEHGSLVPEVPLDLPEGTEVIVTVHQTGAGLEPPRVGSPEERKRLMQEFVSHVIATPFSGPAPRFSRDDMHERG